MRTRSIHAFITLATAVALAAQTTSLARETEGKGPKTSTAVHTSFSGKIATAIRGQNASEAPVRIAQATEASSSSSEPGDRGKGETHQNAGAFEFEIPAQPLNIALREFSRLTSVQIAIQSELAKGKTATKLEGKYQTEEALTRLLKGTGLSAYPVNDHTYGIRETSSIPAAELTKSSLSQYGQENGQQDSELRLAQVEGQENQSQPDSEIQNPSSAPTNDEESANLEEVVVTGTNIRNVDVAAPTIVIGRTDFQKAGFNTLDDVFAALPQNFNAFSASGSLSQEGASDVGIGNATTDRAAGVDLRGLGPESTLTLLNGNRRAGSAFGTFVDISAIPLAAVERVEVVTGGRSAVYGSDAVAGVVNVVTRHDFAGAETSLSYGQAKQGARRAQFSQILGHQSDRAGIVAAFDVLDEGRFDLVPAGLARPTFQGDVPVRRDALPDAQRVSAYAAGRRNITNSFTLDMDTLYTYRRDEVHNAALFPTASRLSTNDRTNANRQFGVGGGAELDIGKSWNLTAKAGYSESVSNGSFLQFQDQGPGTTPFESTTKRDENSTLKTVSLVSTGDLATIAGITPKVAVGVEQRWEGFKSNNSASIGRDGRRNVRSGFGELVLPLFGEKRGEPMLELSAAGRYDDYSDFGSVFNPQAGVIFRPVSGLRFSGAYSKAFRAPALSNLGSSNFILLVLRPDPTIGGAERPVFRLTGDNPILGPEKASGWSVTASYQPPSMQRTNLEISYFNVDYRNRIGTPIFGADESRILDDRFAEIINRSPTQAQLDGFIANAPFGAFNLTGQPFDPATQTILEAFPDIVLLDSRTANFAVEKVSGIDFRAITGFASGIGDIGLGISGTYTIDHKRKSTAASPLFPVFNEVGKPVDLRLRGEASWSSGPFAANLFVNYTDSYANPFSTPPTRISSWTTVDLTLRVDGSVFGSEGFLRSSFFSLSASNLFNERPPLFADSEFGGVLYDPANANPFGRILTARLSIRY